jgi:hypothetical protein
LFAPGALADRTVFTDLGEGFVLTGIHSCSCASAKRGPACSTIKLSM